ncbi:MAG: hypothetical protein ACYDBX_00200 [Patescibacteria group bacterium]
MIAYLIALSPVIKAQSIALMGGNIDYVAHIPTAYAYAINRNPFSDYPGYHLVLAFFYIFDKTTNIISIYILFNAYIVSLFFGSILFFIEAYTSKYKNIKSYYIYIVSFILTFTSLLYIAFIDNFSPQLFVIPLIPLIMAIFYYLIKNNYSLRYMIFFSLLISLSLYIYPAAIIALFFLLILYLILDIKNIKKFLIIFLLITVFTIPGYKGVYDFVLTGVSNVGSNLPSNISPNLNRKIGLSTNLGMHPLYSIYKGPDLFGEYANLIPNRLDFVYENSLVKELLFYFSIIILLVIPFLIYLFRKDKYILSIIIGLMLSEIFGYIYLSVYGDFKVISFLSFFVGTTIFFAILKFKTPSFEKKQFIKFFRFTLIFLLIIYLFLYGLSSALIATDDTPVALSNKNIMNYSEYISKLIPPNKNVLVLDPYLGENNMLYILLKKDNVSVNAFNLHNAPLRNTQYNISIFNFNVFKNIKNYNYIILYKSLVNENQFLLPAGFNLFNSKSGFYVFKRTFIPIKYITLTKTSNNGETNTPTILGPNSKYRLFKQYLRKNQSYVVGIYSFKTGYLYSGSNKYFLNPGYNTVRTSYNSIINNSNLPYLIYWKMKISNKDLNYINMFKQSILKKYNTLPPILPLKNQISIQAGSTDSFLYLNNFAGQGHFGPINFQYISNISTINIPINVAGNMKFDLSAGMYGENNNTNTLYLSTNTCKNFYSHKFKKNDITYNLNINIPSKCITSNYLQLHFFDNPTGNQVLFTNMSLKLL